MKDVHRCSEGMGTGLEDIEPNSRQMYHFANYYFFSWWAAVAAGPITIVVLIINQILVIFYKRLCAVSIFIFLVSSTEVYIMLYTIACQALLGPMITCCKMYNCLQSCYKSSVYRCSCLKSVASRHCL